MTPFTFHPKVTSGALAGALATIITFEANRRGIPIDGGEGAALTVLLSFVAGYFTPSDVAQP